MTSFSSRKVSVDRRHLLLVHCSGGDTHSTLYLSLGVMGIRSISRVRNDAQSADCSAIQPRVACSLPVAWTSSTTSTKFDSEPSAYIGQSIAFGAPLTTLSLDPLSPPLGPEAPSKGHGRSERFGRERTARGRHGVLAVTPELEAREPAHAPSEALLDLQTSREALPGQVLRMIDEALETVTLPRQTLKRTLLPLLKCDETSAGAAPPRTGGHH